VGKAAAVLKAQNMGGKHAVSVDPGEIAQFDALAARWWDPSGPLRPLHAMNPVRLDFIVNQACRRLGRQRRQRRPLDGVRVLDVGCGGGLACEPLARLGAAVTGVDAAANNIAAARAHAQTMGLDIDYRAEPAEALAGEQFDVVLALEVVEHVADVPAFLGTLRQRCADPGLVVLSTLNRTARSFLTAIVGAEYVVRLLPRGTHDWRKFLTPDELAAKLQAAGFAERDRSGMVMALGSGRWHLSADVSVNYLIAADPA